MRLQKQQTSSQPYRTSWILLLALLTAFGPLSIDMYLPALPQMAQDFGVSTQMISNSVPAYFLGLALGQLFYGPWSDWIGRKTPLYMGLTIYSIASFACAFAPNEWTLIIARIFQALGGCVGVVMARAAIRDCLAHKDAANAFAQMMMVMTIAPIVAPSLGAWLMAFFHWQSIFVFLGAVGVFCLICVHRYFDETLAASKRLQLNMGQMLHLYVQTLQDRRFSLPMTIGCIFSAILFVYISAAAHIFMDGLHVSEQQFALIFGANAVGILLLSSLNKILLKHYPVLHVVLLGGCVQAFGAFFLIVSAVMGLGLVWIWLGCLLCVSGIGLTGPNTMALAMQYQQQRAGTASALMGCVQYLFGLGVGVVVNLLPGTGLLNAGLLIAILSITGLYLIFNMRKSTV